MPLTAEKICTAPSSRALSAPPFLGLTPPAGMKRDRQEYPDAPNDPSLLTDQRPIGIADSPNPSTHCLSARPRVRHWSPPPDLSPDRRYVPWLLKVGEPRAIGGCASAVALAAPDAHPRQGRTGRRGREHPHSPQSLACGRQRAAGISPFLKQYVRSLTPRWGGCSASSTGCGLAGTTRQYPPTDSPEITPADVLEDQKTAEALIDLAARLLDEMSPF